MNRISSFGLLATSMLCLTLAERAGAQTVASEFTTYTRYDVFRRVTGEIKSDPDGLGTIGFAATRYTYDTSGRLVTIEVGELATYQPDSVTPSAWTGFNVLQTTNLVYDAMGQKTGETVSTAGSAKKATQFSYDSMGRPVCTAMRMNPAIFAALPVDPCLLGTQGAGADAFGPDRITKNSYDSAGRLTKTQKALGTTLQQDYVTYGYSLNDKPTSVKDANDNLATLFYDGFDRKAAWIFPSKTTVGAVAACNIGSIIETSGVAGPSGAYVAGDDCEKYSYDRNGNQAKLMKRDGSILSYDYDALNRMTRKVVPERVGLGTTHTRDVFYAYDLRGLQTQARFDGSSGEGVTNVYNALGRLTAATENMDGQSRNLSFIYDADGNRLRITWPDSAYLSSIYDGLDRLKRINDAGSAVLIDRTYNSQGLLATSDPTGTPPRLNFAYDGIGQLAELAIPFGPTPTRVTWTYARNPSGQITNETRTNDSYAWGGHISVNRGYSVNGQNQYTTAGPAAFCYDANGNLTADGTSVYLYDVENRLVEKRTQTNTVCSTLSYSGTLQASLRYDPLGRLYEVVGSSTTRFLYEGDALVGEYDAAGTLLRRYGHGSDAGADDPLIWFDGASALSTNARYLYPDPRGSIVLVTDAAGSSIAINSYDEYGIPGAANQGRFQYTGQAWLAEIGMYHYKARIYSPTLGRFLQTDPIGYEDQMNLYAYVGNDPVNMQDPSGLQEKCSGDQTVHSGHEKVMPQQFCQRGETEPDDEAEIVVTGEKKARAETSTPAQQKNGDQGPQPGGAPKDDCVKRGSAGQCQYRRTANGKLELDAEYAAQACKAYNAMMQSNKEVATAAGATNLPGLANAATGNSNKRLGRISSFFSHPGFAFMRGVTYLTTAALSLGSTPPPGCK